MQMAALYLRLSKEDLEKEENKHYSRSIVNQKEILEKYASAHDYTVYEIYTDDDYSGLYFERPAFSKMLEDAQNHKFTVILAKSQSRLSRNMEHTEYLLHDLFPLLGIRFIGVVDGVDTAQKYGKKARQINALVNEWYCEDLSENIRAVYRRKMEKGEYLGAYAPYGYQKSQTDTHKLIVDEKAAYWVKQIFEWYMQGYSPKSICAKLTNAGVANPISYRKQEQIPDCKWSESTIKKMLANETYTGAVIQGKSKRRSFKDKTLQYIPQSEWVIVRNTQEAIISRELYQEVKKIRKIRRNAKIR